MKKSSIVTCLSQHSLILENPVESPKNGQIYDFSMKMLFAAILSFFLCFNTVHADNEQKECQDKNISLHNACVHLQNRQYEKAYEDYIFFYLNLPESFINKEELITCLIGMTCCEFHLNDKSIYTFKRKLNHIFDILGEQGYNYIDKIFDNPAFKGTIEDIMEMRKNQKLIKYYQHNDIEYDP